ncbi:MAG: hypothetical protein ACHQ6U_03835 [Thermodesulfobacteriota bacterium]
MSKTAIIPGSSRGIIARAVALKLGSQGFSVVVNYAGNTKRSSKKSKRPTSEQSQFSRPL